jgi:hypothetical protein
MNTARTTLVYGKLLFIALELFIEFNYSFFEVLFASFGAYKRFPSSREFLCLEEFENSHCRQVFRLTALSIRN